MTDDTLRYAVYWVPPASDPLAEFGCRWTGWCAESGEKHPRLASPAAGLDLETITRETSLQGLNAVLRAPFRLVRAWKIWSLQRALALLADELEEVEVPALDVAVVDGRVALVTRVPSARLDRLARRVREATAPFESPPRRELAPADPGRDGVEARTADRFHMPLTDRLTPDCAALLAGRIRPMLAEVLDAPRQLGDVALVADPGDGRRARVVEHYPLAGPNGAAGDALACRGPRVYAPLNPADQVAEPTA